MTEKPGRSYTSPLRDAQVQRTRDLILDALTELLADTPSEEITTREVASRAGVSQPTVYRHFPDRNALLEGLGDRIRDLGLTAEHDESFRTLDDLAAGAIPSGIIAERHAVLATAEAVLNSDPRRLSQSSRARTAELRRIVAESLPEYSERDHLRIAALLRNLYSAQVWLRMREEFGIPGDESGPIAAWAMQVLVREIKAGNFPRAADQS